MGRTCQQPRSHHPRMGSGSQVGRRRGPGAGTRQLMGPGTRQPTGLGTPCRRCLDHTGTGLDPDNRQVRESDCQRDSNQPVDALGTIRPTGSGMGPGTRWAKGPGTRLELLTARAGTAREQVEIQVSDRTLSVHATDTATGTCRQNRSLGSNRRSHKRQRKSRRRTCNQQQRPAGSP